MVLTLRGAVFWLLCGNVLVSGCAPAVPFVETSTETQSPVPASTRSQLPRLVLAERHVDLGDLFIGQSATAAFVLKNSGGGLLQLSATTDAAFVSVRELGAIASDAEAVLSVDVDTRALRGEFHAEIHLRTNDPQRSQVVLTVSGRVTVAVQVLPSDHPVWTVEASRATVHELQLRLQRGVEIKTVSCDQSYAGVTVVEQGQLNRTGVRVYRMTVTIHPDAPEGDSELPIRLVTNSETQPEVLITARCRKPTAKPAR